MIVINSIDEKYFELDGVQYARIYQPLKQGLEAISIISIYDSCTKLINSTHYSEFEVDGLGFLSQSSAMKAILEATWTAATGGSADGIVRQESFFWWSTLNTVTEDLLAEDENRGQLFIQKEGDVVKLKLYVESLGSNPNGVEINFVVNGLDLLATDAVLIQGMNTFTVLQNTIVLENDKLQLAVRKGSGSNDIGDGQIYIEIK